MPKFNNLGGGNPGGYPGAAAADFQQIPLQNPPALPSTSQGGAIKPAQAMPLPTMNNSELNLVNVVGSND